MYKSLRDAVADEEINANQKEKRAVQNMRE